MRRRRIDRCVLRAKAALDTGDIEIALEAIDEAASLEPTDTVIKGIAEQIRTAAAPAASTKPPSAPARISGQQDAGSVELFRPHARGVDGHSGQPHRHVAAAQPDADQLGVEVRTHNSPARWLAVAATAVLLSGASGWYWMRSNLNVRQQPTAATALSTDVSSATAADQVVPTLPDTGRQTDDIAQPAPAHADPQSASNDTEATAGYMPPPRAGTPEPVIDAPTGGSAVVKQVSLVNDAAPSAPALSDGSRNVTVPVPPPTDSEAARSTDTSRTGETRVISTSGIPPAPGLPNSDSSLPSTLPAAVESPPPLSAGAVGTSPAAAASPAPVPDDRAVHAVLRQYEAAYTSLDAQAVGVVWPSVDRRALTRAFNGLASQRVRLERCEVRMTGGSARVECAGSAQWTPKIGSGPQIAQRRWTFELAGNGGEWFIVSAAVR